MVDIRDDSASWRAQVECNCIKTSMNQAPYMETQQQCCEHNVDNHMYDKSMYLKYEQIIAVSDAMTTAPYQSATQRSHNMHLTGPDSPGKNIPLQLVRSMQRRILMSRAKSTKLQGLWPMIPWNLLNRRTRCPMVPDVA